MKKVWLFALISLTSISQIIPTYLCKRLDLPYRISNKLEKTCKIVITTTRDSVHTFHLPKGRTIEPPCICGIKKIKIDGKLFTYCWTEGMRKTRKLSDNPFRTISYQDHEEYGPILYAY